MSPRRSPALRPARRSGRSLALLIGVLALIGTAPAAFPRAHALAAAAGEAWSAEEQQFVYLLNRARWSPEAVISAAGLTPGTFLPQPPLAINDDLAASTQARSNDMAANDYFGHQSPLTGGWPNSVARANGYDLPGWWPDEANNIESLHMGSPDPVRVLQSFIESPNHRNHVMGQGWFVFHQEIGVGLAPADRLWSIHTAWREGTGPFLTGVAYQDSNGNELMDLGEGLGGVTITVDGRATTTTTTAGGWAAAVAAGSHTVQASGGGFSGTTVATVRVGQFNVEVDFISGTARSTQPRALVMAYSLCMGQQPTILGTSDDDVIYGTNGPDVIHGLGGSDVIHGLGGNDVICGGPGDDLLWGDAGDDRLVAGRGEDALSGGDGNDLLRGRRDSDTASGGSGEDVIQLH